jgi:hypothetical protein
MVAGPSRPGNAPETAVAHDDEVRPTGREREAIMRATPSTTPSVLAGTVRRTDLVTVPQPDGVHGRAPAPARPAPAPSRGDRLTVDPDDRRRRARIALLELAVSRTAERRRVV